MSWLNIFVRKILFYEYFREDGLAVIGFSGVGYGGRSPNVVFRELKKLGKFKIIRKVKSFVQYEIHFKINELDYVFYSDDWGVGFIYSSGNNEALDDILDFMRQSAKFVESTTSGVALKM